MLFVLFLTFLARWAFCIDSNFLSYEQDTGRRDVSALRSDHPPIPFAISENLCGRTLAQRSEQETTSRLVLLKAKPANQYTQRLELPLRCAEVSCIAGRGNRPFPLVE